MPQGFRIFRGLEKSFMCNKVANFAPFPLRYTTKQRKKQPPRPVLNSPPGQPGNVEAIPVKICDAGQGDTSTLEDASILNQLRDNDESD